MHTPVLLNEIIKNLQIKKNRLYIDATAGEGGHLKKILEMGGKVLGIDQDIGQIENLKIIKNVILINANFSEIEKVAKENNFFPVDGIIFDLGLSMNQINQFGRGFSYKKYDEPLDMRLNDKQNKTASDLINNLTQEQLYEIFTDYSEEINSRAIVKNIISARNIKKIINVGNLTKIIDKSLNRKDSRVYARIFQALRIAVNDEFNNLKKGLSGAIRVLKKSGRLVVITFHSLEDRLVKNFIKEKKLKQLNKKVAEWKNRKSYERSAKIRVISF